MAEGPGPGPVKGGLDKLKGEISCPLCLEIFEDPRMLSCRHVYCKAPCLEGLALRSTNGTISCPECRTVIQVPDVNHLPTAFHINRLKEVYQEMEKDQDESKQANRPPCCRKHDNQPLALYCETCEELTCRDCVLADHQHTDHKYGYNAALADKYRKTTLEMLRPVQQLQEEVSHALGQVSTVKTEITESQAAMDEEIDVAFEELLEVIREEKQMLLQSMRAVMEGKRVVVAKQEEELQLTQTELQKVTSSVESAVHNANDEDFLSEKKQIVAKIKQITDKVQSLSLTSAERQDVRVQVVDTGMLKSFCKKSSFAYKVADPSKCTVEGDSLSVTETDKVTKFTLHLVDCEGSPCIGQQKVTAELTSVRDGSVTTANVVFITPGQYEASYRTETRGRHKLCIKVNDIHIANSPFSVYIEKLPQQIKAPVAVIPDLKCPGDLAYSNGHVLIAEENNSRLTILSCNKLQMVGTIGAGYLNGPSGVAIDHQSNVYVCTSFDDKLHKFNKEGELLKSVGGLGKLPGQFDYPNGNRVIDNKLFVCDSGNHRIQIFDLDLNPQRVIGSKGTRRGYFNFPSDVDCDSSGIVYIVDSSNHRIQAMNPDGKFLHIFGKKRCAPGELAYPHCIVVRGQLLYITDNLNNRVSVFHTSGQFITTFGDEYLYEPEGLAIDEDGFVYVTSHEMKVLVF